MAFRPWDFSIGSSSRSASSVTPAAVLAVGRHAVVARDQADRLGPGGHGDLHQRLGLGALGVGPVVEHLDLGQRQKTQAARPDGSADRGRVGPVEQLARQVIAKLDPDAAQRFGQVQKRLPGQARAQSCGSGQRAASVAILRRRWSQPGAQVELIFYSAIFSIENSKSGNAFHRDGSSAKWELVHASRARARERGPWIAGWPDGSDRPPGGSD